jgi:hypothetical protein
MNIKVLNNLHSFKGFSRRVKLQAISTAIMVVASFLTASPASAYTMNRPLMHEGLPMQTYTTPDYDYAKMAMIVKRDSFEIIKVKGWAHGYYQGDIVEYARTFIGKVKYAAAGTTPETGFDCSGFLQFLYSSSQDITLPHSADTQASMGKRIPADKAKPGDWLWWPNQHIALYSGDGKMIHSPRSGKKVEEDKIWGNPIYIRFDA